MIKALYLFATVSKKNILLLYFSLSCSLLLAQPASLNLFWTSMGPDNIGGRTRALIYDNQVANKLWAGSTGGGLFSSLDGGNTWSRVVSYSGFFPIGSIAQASNGDLYVGTGEGLGNPIVGSSFSTQSAGNGIYKSTDGGNSWHQLIGTDAGNSVGVVSGNCAWCAVNDIAVSPTNHNLVLAATQGGLRVSSTGGEDLGTWTLASGISSSLQGQDIEISADGKLAFAAFGGRVFRSDDFANSFMSGWVSTSIASGQRAEIALAPSNENYVYVSVSASNSCLKAIWRSTDKGLTWNVLLNGGTPFVNDPFNNPLVDAGICAGQGWYDQTLAVNPVDESKIYIGGMTFYTWSDGMGLRRADLTELEGGNAFNTNYLHSDKHQIVFNPYDLSGNQMFIASDGGLASCNNALVGFPDNFNFVQRNKNYATLQVYGFGVGAYGEILAGSQSNGNQYIDGLGSSAFSSKQVTGRDGVYAEISNFDPDVLFCGMPSGAIRRSVNRGLSIQPFVDVNIGRTCDDIHCTVDNFNCNNGGDAPYIYPFYLMETSTVSNPLSTAFLRARNDTTLLPSGATQILYDTLYHDYQVSTTITITNGQALVDRQVINTSILGYEYTSAVSNNITFYEELGTSVLYPGEIKYTSDPYDAKYFVSSNCGLWMCINPLQKEEEPIFYKISSSPGGIGGFDASKDGNILYVVAGASLYIIQGFNTLNASLNSGGCLSFNCTSGLLSVDTIDLGFGSSFISSRLEGVAVDKNDPNTVLVVRAGFDNTNRVWRIENALSANPLITPLHGQTLPSMPLYDCVIDYSDPNNYILGTELGIWTSDDAGLTWTEDNLGMFGRMPVYRLRQEWMYDSECMVLYAGTHGGGVFRSTSLTAGGCELTPFKYFETQAVSSQANIDFIPLTISPNPVNSVATVSFYLLKQAKLEIEIMDLNGKVVLTQKLESKGSAWQESSLNLSFLPKSTYFLNLRSEGKILASKKFIKN